MQGENLYELRRDGHSYEMAADNLSTTNIGLVFGVSIIEVEHATWYLLTLKILL